MAGANAQGLAASLYAGQQCEEAEALLRRLHPREERLSLRAELRSSQRWHTARSLGRENSEA